MGKKSRVVLAIVLVLLLFHIVAFAVYATWSAVTGLEPPTPETPGRFMLSVLVQKIGNSLTFVLLFHIARSVLSRKWLTYAFLWWLFSVFGEMGEALLPSYSLQSAVAGIVAEAIYFPAAAWVTNRLLSDGSEGHE